MERKPAIVAISAEEALRAIMKEIDRLYDKFEQTEKEELPADVMAHRLNAIGSHIMYLENKLETYKKLTRGQE